MKFGTFVIACRFFNFSFMLNICGVFLNSKGQRITKACFCKCGELIHCHCGRLSFQCFEIISMFTNPNLLFFKYILEILFVHKNAQNMQIFVFGCKGTNLCFLFSHKSKSFSL